ncbi:hypothetical protein IDJ75_14670 [Mucilaginibacter rigui]|uniref:MerC domain-containing protein n=1 Tax=Mucilaginibacter rigui TaxID=534635 RepID=A0ABR7X7G7_9SPHI|nr:hypothetical protein [Mucilaginibacter rigui]MBD1386527.1 hypothetical protein [Mucilaginibacter rigui]
MPTKPCTCHADMSLPEPRTRARSAKKTVKAIPSVLTSILIAFFPKCPFCWAVYMSMFSSIGLANIPYMGWLLPVLIGMLFIHLLLLFKKTASKGYLPFFISVCGCLLLITGRFVFPAEKWISLAGMALIISGSLLNSLLTRYLPINFYKNLNRS